LQERCTGLGNKMFLLWGSELVIKTYCVSYLSKPLTQQTHTKRFGSPEQMPGFSAIRELVLLRIANIGRDNKSRKVLVGARYLQNGWNPGRRIAHADSTKLSGRQQDISLQSASNTPGVNRNFWPQAMSACTE